MKRRVFVCSPLRGLDGQPSENNIKLARRLMRAVFDAGHAPFVPHLLYPQVLLESVADLEVSFAANYAFLDVCHEIWVYAHGPDTCSRGMHNEVCWVLGENLRRSRNERFDATFNEIVIRYMPPEFAAVREAFERDLLINTQSIGTCVKCGRINGLNSQQVCLPCFSGIV